MLKPGRRLAAALLLSASAALLRAAEPPVLHVPGAADRTITAASLVGHGRMDVRVETGDGDAVVYHGLPLLEVIESAGLDRKSTRLNSSHTVISYAVFCLKK